MESIRKSKRKRDDSATSAKSKKLRIQPTEEDAMSSTSADHVQWTNQEVNDILSYIDNDNSLIRNNEHLVELLNANHPERCFTREQVRRKLRSFKEDYCNKDKCRKFKSKYGLKAVMLLLKHFQQGQGKLKEKAPETTKTTGTDSVNTSWQATATTVDNFCDSLQSDTLKDQWLTSAIKLLRSLNLTRRQHGVILAMLSTQQDALMAFLKCEDDEERLGFTTYLLSSTSISKNF